MTPTRGRSVCNLYSIAKGQQAIRELSRAMAAFDESCRDSGHVFSSLFDPLRTSAASFCCDARNIAQGADVEGFRSVGAEAGVGVGPRR
jgi:hypothetical protein